MTTKLIGELTNFTTMKKHIYFLLVCLAALTFTACGGDDEDYDPNKNRTSGAVASGILEFPALKGGNSIVVTHIATLNDRSGLRGVNYSVEWDTQLRAQRWSCYKMYNTVNANNVSRYSAPNDGTLSPSCQYPNDPDLPEQYRLTADPYRSSGFDHGHIFPSADRLSSSEANYQTFYITNMQPQNNDFNAGIWAELETQVRVWANKFDTLYVCKGGVIDNPNSILRYLGSGNNKIPVPKYFFMAVLGRKSNNFQATGFYIAQDSHSSTSNKAYAVTIADLQQKTGIDFFCNLPDNIESEVENVSRSKMLSEWTYTK